VARRASGKTFYVNLEIVKLSHLPDCGGYNAFAIISDKENDLTINECLKFIKLKAIHCTYENAVPTLNSIIDGKTAYNQIIKK
jgi:hypothetical protein